MKFKAGDKVVSAIYDNYDCWKGLTVDVAHSGDRAAGSVRCTSNTGVPGAFNPDDLTLVKRRDYVADHARRSLRKLGLTKTEAADFVREVQRGGKVPANGEFSLSSISRKADRQVLLDAFYWALSTRGMLYWESVYFRVKAQQEREEMGVV